jgi:hypothetical protein
MDCLRAGTEQRASARIERGSRRMNVIDKHADWWRLDHRLDIYTTLHCANPARLAGLSRRGTRSA